MKVEISLRRRLGPAVVDDVRHETHEVLHPKTKLLKMLPLLGLFLIVHHDVELI
jgi:hypothetical protein